MASAGWIRADHLTDARRPALSSPAGSGSEAAGENAPAHASAHTD
jgi:hypothetical protein